jgi:hypothetical protein
MQIEAKEKNLNAEEVVCRLRADHSILFKRQKSLIASADFNPLSSSLPVP